MPGGEPGASVTCEREPSREWEGAYFWGSFLGNISYGSSRSHSTNVSKLTETIISGIHLSIFCITIYHMLRAKSPRMSVWSFVSTFAMLLLGTVQLAGHTLEDEKFRPWFIGDSPDLIFVSGKFPSCAMAVAVFLQDSMLVSCETYAYFCLMALFSCIDYERFGITATS